jgi:phage shock protein A
MGIFGRLARLLRSNVNDLIAKAEDPIKILTQALAEMQTQSTEARRLVALAIADEKRLGRQLDAARATADEWHRRAIMAVRAGDDELARVALHEQAAQAELAREFEVHHAKQADTVTKLRRALAELDLQIDEARRKRTLLVARANRVKAQAEIQKALSVFSVDSPLEAARRAEEKIADDEARVDAERVLHDEATGRATEQRFRRLAVEQATERALADLKAQLRTPPATATTQVRVDATPTAPPADARSEVAELETALREAEMRRREPPR